MVVSDPRFWGPSTWRLLHSVSLTYPDRPSPEDAKHYADFFLNLSYVLPCPACRVHFRQFIMKKPVDTTSREALAKWVWEAHTNVNNFSGKRSPPFEKVVQAYTSAPDSSLLRATNEEQGYYLQNDHLDRVLGKNHLSKKENATATTTASSTNTIIDVVLIILAVIVLALAAYRLYQENR